MTRAEFDVWIEEHYVELGKVATARGGSRDTLHDAIVGMLQSEVMPRVGQPGEIGVWPWAVAFVEKTIFNRGVGRKRTVEALKTEKIIRRGAGSQVGKGWKKPAPGAE